MHHPTPTRPRSPRGTSTDHARPEPRPETTETPGWARHDFLVPNQRPDLTTPPPEPQPTASHRD